MSKKKVILFGIDRDSVLPCEETQSGLTVYDPIQRQVLILMPKGKTHKNGVKWSPYSGFSGSELEMYFEEFKIHEGWGVVIFLILFSLFLWVLSNIDLFFIWGGH